MRLLVGLGQHLSRRHLPETTVPLEDVRLPYLRDHRQGLLPHLPGVPGIDAHARLLVGGGPPRAELHTAPGELVHHGHPLGHPYGVMVGQDHHAEAKADTLGQAAQGPEDHLRAGGHGEARQEVVLHEPNIVPAHLVGQDTLLNGLFNDRMVVEAWALHLVGQSELHVFTSTVPVVPRRAGVIVQVLQIWCQPPTLTPQQPPVTMN